MDIEDIISKISDITIELDARNCSRNHVITTLSESWDDLCDKGADMFQKLKEIKL